MHYSLFQFFFSCSFVVCSWITLLFHSIPRKGRILLLHIITSAQKSFFFFFPVWKLFSLSGKWKKYLHLNSTFNFFPTHTTHFCILIAYVGIGTGILCSIPFGKLLSLNIILFSYGRMARYDAPPKWQLCNKTLFHTGSLCIFFLLRGKQAVVYKPVRLS